MIKIFGASEHQNANEISLQSALIQATENGDVGEVKRLIGNDEIAVDGVDSRGMNALFVAVESRNETLVHLLVEEGKAFVNARDLRGRTPLFYAITQSKEIAGYLIQKGADVNLKDFSYRSVLSFFVENCMMTENTPLSSLLSSKSDEFDMLKNPAVDVKHEVIKTILNIVFCKLPLLFTSSKNPTDKTNQESLQKIRENFIPALEVVSTYFEENDSTKKEIVDVILSLCKEEKFDEVIAPLVKIGADPNFSDSDGNTALHYAASLPFLGVSTEVIMSVFVQLESYGLTLNTRNHENQNPLLFCLSGSIGQLKDKLTAMKTSVEVCKFLVRRGSSLEETTQYGESVFHLLINLFQQGFEIPKQNVRQEVVEEMKKLLHLFSCDRFIKGSTVNKGDSCLKSPLHHWAELTLPCPTDDFLQATLKEILEHLLRLGATPNARNEKEETPLHMCKTWSAAKLLLPAGANPNDVDSSGCPPIIAAVKNTTYSMKSDLDQCDNESLVRTLIDAGADVNRTDNEGRTALFYAVQQVNNESVVRALIDAGADVNRTDNEGRTALFYAVQQVNNESVVRALIDAGANVNITDNEGKTALCYAVQQSKNESVVRALIDAGADVNITYEKTHLFAYGQQVPRYRKSKHIKSYPLARVSFNDMSAEKNREKFYRKGALNFLESDKEGKTHLFAYDQQEPRYRKSKHFKLYPLATSSCGDDEFAGKSREMVGRQLAIPAIETKNMSKPLLQTEGELINPVAILYVLFTRFLIMIILLITVLCLLELLYDLLIDKIVQVKRSQAN